MRSSSVLSNGVLSSPIAMYWSYQICTSPVAGSGLFGFCTMVRSLRLLPAHPNSVLAYVSCKKGQERNELHCIVC